MYHGFFEMKLGYWRAQKSDQYALESSPPGSQQVIVCTQRVPRPYGSQVVSIAAHAALLGPEGDG